MGLEYIRYYVYGKKLNLLTDHQALQPLLKRNRAHKQYSARLTRWLDKLSHFDVNVQFTAGKNIPLTDYISRHPIVNTAENETENDGSGQTETESEEFVINQIHGLFDFIQTNGSIKRFTERTKPRQKSDQSHHDIRKREQNKQNHSLEASLSLNRVNLTSKLLKFDHSAPKTKMDHVNGIDMQFIYEKRGHSSDTNRLWTERRRLLKPEKTRIVGKRSDHERLQEYRPPQQAQKRIVELNIQIYNRFFHFCETLGTTPLRQNQQNNHESWIVQNSSDSESQVSNVRQEKCPTNALKKFRKHETVNWIRLKQTVKANTMDDDQNEHTEETIKKTEKDFALDLLMLVDETTRVVKILSAIAALENLTRSYILPVLSTQKSSYHQIWSSLLQ